MSIFHCGLVELSAWLLGLLVTYLSYLLDHFPQSEVLSAFQTREWSSA
jgi:hypothetical protein